MAVDLVEVFQVGRIIETTVEQFISCIPHRRYSLFIAPSFTLSYVQSKDKYLGICREITTGQKRGYKKLRSRYKTI